MSSESRRPRRWRRWIFVILLLTGAWWLFRGGGMTVSIDDGSYILVDIEGSYHERLPDGLLTKLAGDEGQSLVDLLLLLRGARDDSRVAGVVARIGGLDLGWAKAQEIRAQLQEFRDSGKKLVVYLENELGNSTLEYYLASVAEEIYAPPAGSVVLSGLLAEYMFLGGVWEKLDVDMQVVKIGEYKTAGDIYDRKSMSAAHREMANSLLDSLYGQFVSAIASSRNLSEERVRELVDRGPVTLGDLEAAGLIDGARYLDEIEVSLVGHDGAFVPAEDFARRDRQGGDDPVGRVAVVYGVGMITTGDSVDALLGDQSSMGSDTMRETFEEIAADDDVDAIVFRVDSPGGSALASDLIWRATQQARDEKPVIVSMSDVAGSGGYYVAAGATRILAAPGTLTGSIGVVMAKPNINGLLEKLGIHTATVQRGKRAGLLSTTQSLGPEDLQQVRDSMEQVYGLFVDRVASGRAMSFAEVDALGRGRVWTGEQARDNGLVDQLGGVLAAIDEAKKTIGVDPSSKVELVFYPRSQGLYGRLAEALGAGVGVRLPSWLVRLRQAVAALEFPEGSILTLMPQRVDIR